MLQVEALGKHNDPAIPDILYVGWLDYHPFMKQHLEGGFVQIFEDLNRSNITKMVLDTSRRMNHPGEEELKDIYALILGGLATTGVKKMARVSLRTARLEEKYRGFVCELKAELNLDLHLCHFNNTRDAVTWLQADDLVPVKNALIL